MFLDDFLKVERHIPWTDKEVWHDTCSKYKSFLTVAMILTILMMVYPSYLIGLKIYHYKHRYDIVITPPDPKPDVVRFITTDQGTKIVRPPEQRTYDQMPENTYMRNTIFFLKDGSAMVYSYQKYDGSGRDIIWKSNGKWYGILIDKEVPADDIRNEKYEDSTNCICSLITIVDRKYTIVEKR